jgi:hypothetical protein
MYVRNTFKNFEAECNSHFVCPYANCFALLSRISIASCIMNFSKFMSERYQRAKTIENYWFYSF